MAPLAAAPEIRGGRAAEEEVAEPTPTTATVPSSRRLSDRGRRRGRTVSRGWRPVFVLVLFPDHPDPLLPALVDPAGRPHDRRLRRRPPRALLSDRVRFLGRREPRPAGHRGPPVRGRRGRGLRRGRGDPPVPSAPSGEGPRPSHDRRGGPPSTTRSGRPFRILPET